MKIQKRIVDQKRHTVGYVVDGQRQTRGAICDLIRRGHTFTVGGKRISRKRGPNGWYLFTRRNVETKLYDLPEKVEVKARSTRTRKVAK